MSGDKPYERAGSFYLGRRREPEAAGEPLLYDARDLLTHAVIVGMTGSGKTGLGIAILEEAALAGVPALVVDPKGDMANLLLQFPELAAEDFEPWIDAADAARAGRDPREEAERVAQQWREGLASWDQGPERVARLAEAADFAVYTPGSTAGRPLAILASLVAPPAEVRGDAELLAERIDATSAALLALLGIDFDPVQSRESILAANLLQHAWSRGQDLSLEALVTQVQSPPFPRLGVLDLETFYPSKDRARLALALNALLASPSFAAWITGDPLDVQRLLWAEDGRPRVSVISIAHLSDRERVFFVSLLLAEVLAWMRAQSGTSSLRALFYMDEIFGFFPPTAEPPTKRPMLTLLKQARAFGLGCVLATQNPVDLDYKGLANCGTWFLGRLQTERDKLRVLDGLEGALAAGGRSVDRAAIDRILSSLGPRVFFLSNVHADGPVLFQTRWVLSWLRGPMTRAEIRRLAERDDELEDEDALDDDAIEDADADEILAEDDERAEPAPAVPEETPDARGGDRPPLPDGVSERYLPRPRVRARDAGASRAPPPARAAEHAWRAALAAEVRLHYVRSGSGVDVWRREILVADLPRAGTAIEWALARAAPAGSSAAWKESAPEALAHAPVTAAVGNARTFARWRKDLAEHLYQTRTLEQWSCKGEGLTSELDESRDAFLERCRAAQRERRDEAIEKLRKRYAPKHAALLERVRQAQHGVERQSEQYREKRTSSWLAAGASLIGAFFGRSVSSSARRVESTARAAAGARRERADVERAERDLAAARKRLSDLEVELDREIAVVEAHFAAADPELTPIVIRPRKSDVDVGEPTVLWRPWRIGPDGELDPAW